MWGFLFFAAAVAAVGLLVWNYRRKMREREALGKARFEEMFENERGGTRASSGAKPVVAPPRPADPAAGGPAPAPGPFLTQPETLVYFLLRAAMPDHVVFAKVPLSSVIGRQVPVHLLDFVVCDKSMRVTAVVEIAGAAKAGAGGKSAPDAIKAQRLSAADVRLVAIDVGRLPSRSEVRARVLGDAPPAA